MTIWLPDLTGRPGPKYLAIADAIAQAIADGTLPVGTKLPAQRNLAYDIGVTLGTVTRAYREAERRGLVGGEVGRGTYVADGNRRRHRDGLIDFEPSPPGIIDLTHATMPVQAAGRALSKTIAEIAQQPDLSPLADYQIDTAMRRHLEAGAAWLTAKGVASRPDQVALSSGVQHGTMTTMMAVARSGDGMIVEALTYPGVIRLAQQLGHRLDTVAMDSEGMIPDALDEVCRRTAAKLLYCQPTVHNPTTATMSEARREQIAEVARRHNLFIIEDNVWAAVAPDHPPPLATFAPERTFFISGPAKAMAGGLRIAFVHCPEGQVERVRATIRMTSWMAVPLMAEITARWVKDGTGEALTETIRETITERLALAEKYFRGFEFHSDPAVSFFWLELPAPWRAADFRAEAEARGIRVLTAETFTAGREPAPHAVRISVGGKHSAEEVEGALAVLTEILKSPPGAATAVM